MTINDLENRLGIVVLPFYLQFLEIVHMTLSISNCPLQDFQAIANGNTSGSDEALSMSILADY